MKMGFRVNINEESFENKVGEKVKEGFLIVAIDDSEAEDQESPIKESSYYFFPGDRIDYKVIAEIYFGEGNTPKTSEDTKNTLNLLRIFIISDDFGMLSDVFDALFEIGFQYQRKMIRQKLDL